MQPTRETFVEFKGENINPWIKNVYNTLIGDIRGRVMQGPTVKRHMVCEGMWTLYGASDRVLPMKARDLHVGNEQIVVGFNEHKIFNWDISAPKVQVASKIGDDSSIIYYLTTDQGRVECMHRRYDRTGPLGHWEPITPHSTSMDTFITILRTIDRELSPVKK